MSEIRNISLAGAGRQKIAWVRSYMPVLSGLESRFERDKPFLGRKIAVSIHLEAKTANLAIALRAGGAEVFITGSNPLSTQDEIAAALAEMGFEVFAYHGATDAEYRDHLVKTLACRPDIIIDDGGDFVELLHGECACFAVNVTGGCEETTTGLSRLRAREREGKLRFPMIAVNDAESKCLFDNHHGTGQSVWDAIMHSTNNMISGKTVVVAGFGHCGSGIAERASGLGANVIVTEINPVRALEAAMRGFRVMKMDDACALGEIFVCATGCNKVITARHFEKMRDGVLLSNAGHFDVEVDKPSLEACSVSNEVRKPGIRGYRTSDGRWLNLLGEGRLVNLAAGNGHPAEIMDMSFAVQALCALEICLRGKDMAPGVHNVPAEVDGLVSRLKAEAMGLGIDELSEEQKLYINSY